MKTATSERAFAMNKKDKTEMTAASLAEVASLIRYYADQYTQAAAAMEKLRIESISVTGITSLKRKVESIQGHINSVNNAISRRHAGLSD